MSEQKDKLGQSSQKKANRYRLVLLDEDTLGELKSIKTSKAQIVLFFTLTILLISILTAAIIAFTPLRQMIPGYAEISNNHVYMDLVNKLQRLSDELDAQKVYTEGIKNRLNPSREMIENIQRDSLKNEKNLFNQPIKENLFENVSLDHYYFCPPVKGEISAAFDLKEKHFGIDIVAEKDSPVKAVLDGVVVNADWSVKTGNTISIQHKNDIISTYKHNSVLLKRIGEQVKLGEAIAIIGNTGILTNGPHVHFELWHQGKPINPTDFISFDK